VQYDSAPLLVLAGAGSGKTRVITAKIAHLVTRGVAPDEIVAITFTNKAAREMRERARRRCSDRCGDAAAKMAISTFHAYGLRSCAPRRARWAWHRLLDLRSGRCRADRRGARRHGDRARGARVQRRIGQWKNALTPPAAALREARTDDALVAARAYAGYRDALAAYQAVDFDDLIALPVALFERDAAARARWQARCAHVLIDEYQDTNPAQYRLFRHLVGDATPFTASATTTRRSTAGAARRSTTWRAPARLSRSARHQARAELPVDRPHPALRNALIGNNPKLFDKRLWTELAHGDPLRVTPAADEEAEAELVVRRIGAQVRASDAISRSTRSCIAAITRRARSRPLCARSRFPTRSRAGSRCSSARRSRTSSRTCG
jgi:ATP-dependent DNA helicase Rep